MTTLTFGTPKLTPIPAAPQIAPQQDAFDVDVDDLGLGTNITSPFTRGPSDFVVASGNPLLSNQVVRVLSARSANGKFPGDFRAHPEFGSKLWLLKNFPLNGRTRALATIFTQEALAIWVPFAVIDTIVVTFEAINSPVPNALQVVVEFHKKGSLTDTEAVAVQIPQAA